MTDNHPITPSPELVVQWRNQAPEGRGSQTREMWIATQAAQYGADQELEACCEWLRCQNLVTHCALIPSLRAARRPKPPSLKEQALLQLDTLNADLAMHGRGCDLSQIRRALEQLND